MLNPQMAVAFFEEMEKIALGWSTLTPNARNLLGSAATLGVLGSGVGGGMGYLKAKAEGADTGTALTAAGKGALVGGTGGAALGAGLGGFSRLLRGANPVTYARYVPPAERAAMEAAGRLEHGANVTKGTHFLKSMDKNIADFGRRQLHALFGYVPKGVDRNAYLRDIGIGGRMAPEDVVQLAREHLSDVEAGRVKGFIPIPQSLRRLNAKWDLFNAEQAAKANQELMEAGATSLPGMVRAAFSKERRAPLVKGVGRDLLFGGGVAGTLMMGMGGYDLYKGIRGDVLPGQENMGRGERLGEAIGNAAGWMLPTPLPMAGQVVGGTILNKAFGTAGRLADKILGNKPPGTPYVRPPITDPTDPVASTAQQLGPQVVMSPSAAGKPYGGGFEQ